MNPSCRAAYWSVVVALCVWSIPQVAGCPHAGPRGVATVRSRAGLFPMSSRYAVHDSFAADSWLPSVGTDRGKTHPPSGASTWWYGPMVTSGVGTQTGQSSCVRMFGAWPEICAM